jgi:hypothetical protein
MCSFDEICITTDGCDLSVQGTGCVPAPPMQPCSCGALEAALTNNGCPPSWVANTNNAKDTPATGCTIDCN